MKKTLFLYGISLLLFWNLLRAQTFPEDFSIFNIASGWVHPIGAQFSTDGERLFVWEKGGRVYVCNRDAGGVYLKQTQVVLNISDEVCEWGDHGLTGFALDPNFANNGYIYLFYVVDRRFLFNDNSIPVEQRGATIGRVTRYKTIINGSGNLVIDPNPVERKILIGESPSTGIPQLHDSHSIGSLVFATDGTLMVSAGDGASYNSIDAGAIRPSDSYMQQALDNNIITDEENVGAFRSQMLNSHSGKLLRINPANGNGVSSNPFYSAEDPRSPKSRVWALGFRNPFRFTLRPGTGSTDSLTGDIGEIYIGDVGWGAYEELNIIKAAGMNCGWPIFEGFNLNTGVNHSNGSYAGYNPENKDEPNPSYNGGSCNQQYFKFRDLIKQATADGITTVYNPCNASVIGSGNRYFHRLPAIDWRHGGGDSARVGIFDGSNFVVTQIGSPEAGVIGTPFRGNCAIGGCWYTGNLFPANFRNTYFQADFGEQWLKSITIDFTDVVQEVQDFASGLGQDAIVCITENPLDGTLVYVDIGTQTVKTITYGGNQFPVVKMNSDKTHGTSPLTVNFTGDISFDPDNNNPISYSWDFGDGTAINTSANPSHIFITAEGNPQKYTVVLTVTDNGNPVKSSTDSIIISVNNTPPSVDITSPIKNSTYIIGGDTTYTLAAMVTDAEHSQGQLKYAWQTILRHNNHQHAGAIDTVMNSSVTIGRPGCNGDDYYWFIELTVTDAAGLSTIDSSQIFPACASVPLPLLLRKFSVTQQGNENLVKWTTESEMYIEYFEVERSTDGVNFLPINQTAARNTSGPNEYNFTDHNFSTGVNYYRLKIVEAGSIIRYSVIVKTFSDIKSEGLVISPNPVTGNFSVSYTAADSGPVILRISDVNGKLINTIRESVNRGQNIIYLQSMPAWKSGIYLVSVQQGDDVQHGKFIKAE
jgi:glucose/arabinose dehydrogenase/PKD repeat protein